MKRTSRGRTKKVDKEIKSNRPSWRKTKKGWEKIKK